MASLKDANYNRPMNTLSDLNQTLRRTLNRERMLGTAQELVAIPSRTGEAGAVSDRLASLLSAEGFSVERHEAGHAAAPAVVVRLDSGRPGPTLQFTGHLDTVHLPFVPPAVVDGNLTGSGASDMKGGTSAAVEALRILWDTKALQKGSVLFVAHDLHEAPWGFGQQLDHLIKKGLVGDAVLLPEPLSDRLPVVGRGAATWKVTIRRSGPPVHEVMRPTDQPSVIGAGAELVQRLGRLAEQLKQRHDPVAGPESVFIGQIHSGEIYNQYPHECMVEGTRRWLPNVGREEVEREFRGLLTGVEHDTGTTITAEFRFIRDAFYLDQASPLVTAFQRSYSAISGEPLPIGPKMFVDDGNSFWGLAKIPAITHGPKAGGQHTVNEWVSIDDMERVAHLYALTAVLYCGSAG